MRSSMRTYKTQVESASEGQQVEGRGRGLMAPEILNIQVPWSIHRKRGPVHVKMEARSHVGFLPDPIHASVRGFGGLMLSIDWSTILQNSFLILEVQYYNHTKKIAFNWDIASYGQGAISRPFRPKNYLEFYCISLILRGIIFFFSHFNVSPSACFLHFTVSYKRFQHFSSAGTYTR